MHKEDLILIKLGGSLITDKSKKFRAREGVIKRLGREIAEARRVYRGKLIIGHGSGSFGHTVASRYKTHEGLIRKDSLKGLTLTADVASQINRITTKNLLKSGLPVMSFAPASLILAKNQNLHKFFLAPIVHSLETGVIPLVYGDTIMDVEKGFCIFSAEKVLNTLIRGLSRGYKILRIIHCGRTDGVYDSRGQSISKITPRNFKSLKWQIGESEEVDVTGGMLHKVEESLKVTRRFGIEALIIDGSAAGQLKKALLGQGVKGTVIAG